MRRRIAVMGIGNELKGDDAIGPLISEKIKNKLKDDKKYEIIHISTNVPENFMGKIDSFNPDILLMIDAADFNENPGHFRLIDIDEISRYSLSTHNMPLSIFLKNIGIDENNIFFIGVQIKSTEFGSDITEEVLSTVPKVMKLADDVIHKHP